MRESSFAIRLLGVPLLAATLPALLAWSAEPAKKAPRSIRPSKTWSKALQNEAAGDNARRTQSLQDALKRSPRDAATHWQLGQVRMDGQWLTPDQAQKIAAGDKRLAQYRTLRDRSVLAVDSQAALARWCHKNKLFDEERAHWQTVLQLQPGNPDAIQGLGLKPYAGMLLTQPQIQQIKAEMHKLGKAMDRWRPLVARWLRAVEHHETAPPAEVRDKLAKISDSADMVAFERVLWQEVGPKRHKEAYRAMLLGALDMLSGNPRPAAAECLARLAVFSDFADVHVAAIEDLKKRPLDQYAPLLLSGLQMPIQAEVNTLGGFGIRCSLYQEGALADVSLTWDWNASLWLLFDDGTLAATGEPPPLTPGAVQYVQMGEFQAVRNVTSAIERANEVNQWRNARITAALTQLTGCDRGSEPMPWWSWWWQDYNEMYNVSSGSSGTTEQYQPPKPVYQYTQWQEYRVIMPYSCFAAGTNVWTLAGPQAIEKIQVGDRVLAQDVETGELTYKPVLAVTTRAPGPRMRVRAGSDTITATPGHPFWVAGQGWRMTKQLEVGSRLHTLSGSAPVETIEKLPVDPSNDGMAYNLIVADFDSYFVGDSGILVHDNTPRQPTSAILPGLKK